ncbi:MAG: hypothetical protein MK180_09375 [Rhodobacteraceae bacterium]|nr:hypothetical protein [Paracoccaceae bacterium]
MRWAAGFGVKSERDVERLTTVALALGHRFWEDPRFKGFANGSMADPSIPLDARARKVTKTAEGYLLAL